MEPQQTHLFIAVQFLFHHKAMAVKQAEMESNGSETGRNGKPFRFCSSEMQASFESVPNISRGFY